MHLTPTPRVCLSPTQVEATSKVTELFPNLVRATAVAVVDSSATEEDATAGNAGAGFTEVEDEDEWMGWFNWDDIQGA